MMKKIVAIALAVELAIVTFFVLIKSLILWILFGFISTVVTLSVTAQQIVLAAIFLLSIILFAFILWHVVKKSFKTCLIITFAIPIIGFIYYLSTKEPDKRSVLAKELRKVPSVKPAIYDQIKCLFETNMAKYYDTIGTDVSRNNLFLALFNSDKKNISEIKLDTLIFSPDFKYAYVLFTIKQPDQYIANSIFCKIVPNKSIEFIPGSIYWSFDKNKGEAVLKLRYDAFITSRTRYFSNYSGNDYKTWEEKYPSPIDKDYWLKSFPLDSVKMRTNGTLVVTDPSCK